MHPTLKPSTEPLTYFGTCLLGALLLTFGCDSKESGEGDTNAGATETDPSGSDGATSNPTSSEPMDTSSAPTDADPTELDNSDDSDDSETTDAMTSDDEATDPDTEPTDAETTDSDSEPTDAETTDVTSEPTESDPTSDETEPTSGDDASTDDAPSVSPCTAPDLVWRSANKTNYESYPDPGSEECIEFNGCEWEGQFAACNDKMSEAWVAEHNIVAAFPDFDSLQLHDLCLRRGDNTIVVTVLDTCGDSDCDGCCTENKGDAEQLIDLEYYTNERWGESDGQIEWADLGPTQGDGCSGE